MQSPNYQELEQKTLQYVRKMPFLKAVILSELKGGDVELFRWVASDLVFKQEASSNFLNCLRGGMTELFTDFRGQFSKVCDCQREFEVSVLFDQYFVRKAQIGQSVLLVAICEAEGLDLGALNLMQADYRSNLAPLDRLMEEVAK